MTRLACLYGKGIAAPGIVLSMAKALIQCGYDVNLVPLKQDLSLTCQQISMHKPDMVISLDHAGFSDPHFLKLSIPGCSYFVDHPFYFLPPHFKPSKNHLFCTVDTHFQEDLLSDTHTPSLHLPLAYDSALLSFSREKALPVFDVSIVGSYLGSSRSLKNDRQHKLPEMMNSILDHAIAFKIASSQISMYATFLKVFGEHVPVLHSLNIEQKGSLFYFLDREADSLKKESFYTACKKFNMHIIGNDAWQSLCTGTDHYKGSLPYGTECFNIYRQSKINLILHRPQMTQGLNQRIYDMAALKSFFLIEKKEAVHALLGEELGKAISFDSPQTLTEKIDYFLNHEAQRHSLIETIHEALKNEHYDQRMRTFSEFIKSVTEH